MRYQLTEEEYRQILEIKRDLHRHPELSLKEYRTTGVIRSFLEKLPGMELSGPGTETGVLARIHGNGEGPEVMLRADIDALPQTEAYESPWKSENPGVMHACGHDFHTASLLGAALLLQRAKDAGELRGMADLLFCNRKNKPPALQVEGRSLDVSSPMVRFSGSAKPQI